MAQRIRARADRERVVLLAEARKEAQIARGEGDGEAVRIFADAFGQDVDFFTFYRSMQAYRDALGDDNTSFVLSPDSEFFRFFGSSNPTPSQTQDARAPASPAPPVEDRAEIDPADDGQAPDNAMVR
jgi:membrane protease subunit HflC